MGVVNQGQIAKNTILLYVRMGLMMLVSFYTSRVVIDALGNVDFGVYTAVGATIAMFSFLSTTLSAASQRYYAFEIGRNNYDELKNVFNICVLVFTVIALLIVIIAEPVGYWYLVNVMDVADRIDAAKWVFHCAIIGFAFNILRTPYLGMIIARENMKVFTYVSIFETLANLAIALVLMKTGYDKLIMYAVLMMSVQIGTFLLYYTYCKVFYAECKFQLYFDRQKFKEIFSFSTWNVIGSTADVLKKYGLNLVINFFFGPVINTPKGVGDKVLMTISQLQTNFFMATKPQLIKSYASNALQEMRKLICQSSKFTYYLLFLVALPFLLETEVILDLWLKDVPERSVLFTRLLIIEGLLDVFTSPLAATMQATGKIKSYQIAIGSTLLLVVPLSCIVVGCFNTPAESIFIVSIFITIVSQFVRLYFVRKHIDLKIKEFARIVILPISVVTIVSVAGALLFQSLFTDSILNSLIVAAGSVVIVGISVFLLGINKSERRTILEVSKKYLSKLKH